MRRQLKEGYIRMNKDTIDIIRFLEEEKGLNVTEHSTDNWTASNEKLIIDITEFEGKDTPEPDCEPNKNMSPDGVKAKGLTSKEKRNFLVTYSNGLKQELKEDSELKARLVARMNMKNHGGDFKIEEYPQSEPKEDKNES